MKHRIIIELDYSDYVSDDFLGPEEANEATRSFIESIEQVAAMLRRGGELVAPFSVTTEPLIESPKSDNQG